MLASTFRASGQAAARSLNITVICNWISQELFSVDTAMLDTKILRILSLSHRLSQGRVMTKGSKE